MNKASKIQLFQNQNIRTCWGADQELCLAKIKNLV